MADQMRQVFIQGSITLDKIKERKKAKGSLIYSIRMHYMQVSFGMKGSTI